MGISLSNGHGGPATFSLRSAMSDDDAKAALRRQMRARRKDLCLDDTATAKLSITAGNLVKMRGALRVGLYAAMGGEISPAAIARELTARAVITALPVVISTTPPTMIFRASGEGQDLIQDVAGIQAPGPDAPEIIPDLIFLPLLALDRHGNRLGQGGGYYDRYLAKRRQEGPPLYAVGLGFSAQLLDSLPAGPYDQALDAFLSEDGLITFQRAVR